LRGSREGAEAVSLRWSPLFLTYGDLISGPVSLLVSSWKEYAEKWDMHPTHNKALSSAYDVDLVSTIQIDDLHEGDAAYRRCGLLLNHKLGRVYQKGNRRPSS
jgi:hypothetical protein